MRASQCAFRAFGQHFGRVQLHPEIIQFFQDLMPSPEAGCPELPEHVLQPFIPPIDAVSENVEVSFSKFSTQFHSGHHLDSFPGGGLGELFRSIEAVVIRQAEGRQA